MKQGAGAGKGGSAEFQNLTEKAASWFFRRPSLLFSRCNWYGPPSFFPNLLEIALTASLVFFNLTSVATQST